MINRETGECRNSVLVVDDDAVCRQFCTRVLAQAGISANGSGSAAQAIELLRTFCPAVILLDFYLPDMTACNFLSLMKFPHSPYSTQPLVLGMTGDDSARTIAAMHAAGCEQVLQKPFSAERLLASLSPAIRRSCSAELHDSPHATAGQQGASGIQPLFGAELARDIDQLDALISGLQWRSARQVLHRLCGAAAIAGYPRFTTRCRQLMGMLSAPGQTAKLASSYFDFRRQAHAIIDETRSDWNRDLKHSE